jgi:hypothetical protein
MDRSIIHDTIRCKKWTGQKWLYCQQKLDGFRVTAYIDKDHNIEWYGKDHRPHLEFLKRFPRLKETQLYKACQKILGNSSIDAEIIVPGMAAADVATALRNPKIPIKIIVFAIPMYSGVMGYYTTLSIISEIASNFNLQFAEWLDYAQIVIMAKITPNDSVEVIKKKLLVISTKKGYEGWVLKDTQYSGWYKVKKVQMIDCIITGVQEGEGKFKGLIGSLEVSVYKGKELVPVASVSGMPDTERKELTKKFRTYNLLGKVVEVKYQEVASQNRLRHPRYSRMRSDKPAKECIWSQLENNC